MPRVFRATPESLAISRDLAGRFGKPFDEAAVEREANRLLTLYFEDVVQAVRPRFDHVGMAEFTRREMNAFADRTRQDGAFVHVDQQVDMWLLGITHLVCVRAFHVLTGGDARTVERLLLSILDTRDRPREHERTRGEMLAVFSEFRDALVVAHELSVAAAVFVICHELAHHELGHLGMAASPEVEFAADRRGHEIMREVYLGDGDLVTLRRQPYCIAGGWLMLSLFDLADRRTALRSGLTSRPSPGLHPTSLDRADRLLALLATEPDERLERFLAGMQATIAEVLSDTGLEGVN